MDNQPSVNVRDFGAVADGTTDDSRAFLSALESKAAVVVIPAGRYLIGAPLKIGSGTTLSAHENAIVMLADNVCNATDDFFLTNADTVGGNENITVEGGVWHGNNRGNRRKDDIFAKDCGTGVMFNFVKVKNFTIRNLRMCDAESYFLRIGEAEDFTVSNIAFEAETLRPNQDGVHLGGYCFNGVIENIRASRKGSTNDDLIALNADDEVNRLVNLGMKRGPIKHIRVRHVYAEDCHSLVRLLSVDAPIEDVLIEDVRGGCRVFALNMDAARYCRTPLFKDDEKPEGVGRVKDVVFRDITAHKTDDNRNPLIFIETNCENFVIERFVRERAKEPPNDRPTFYAGKLKASRLELDDRCVTLGPGETIADDAEEYGRLTITARQG